MKKILSAVILLGAVASGQAAADGLYAQAVYGLSEFGLSGMDGGSAMKAIGGRQYNDYFGLEAQFTDFGKGKMYDWVGGVSLRGELSAKALGVNAVGSLPMGRWVVSGKAGLHYVASKASVSASGFTSWGRRESVSKSKSTKRLTPMIGLSVSYGFTRQLEGVVELDRFRNLTGSGVKKVSGQTGSLGVRYWF